MKRFIGILCAAVFVSALSGPGLSQEQKPDRVVVPLTNPAKPATIEIEVMRGDITVKGYEGKEIIVEARVREKVLSKDGEWDEFEKSHADRDLERAYRDIERAEKDLEKSLGGQPGTDREKGKDKKGKTAGLKLISSAKSGLEVRENANVVTIETQAWKNTVDVTIQAPFSTALKLSSGLNGDIAVSDISGEIEIGNLSGDVNLTGVSGTVVANTMKGDLTVTLNKVAAGKPMAFTTMMGDIDVTLPADLKANVKMKSDQGEIYSDFDIAIKPGPQKIEEGAEPSTERPGRLDGKFHVSIEKYTYGAVNGGGPEISFSTFRGDIYIRKKKQDARPAVSP